MELCSFNHPEICHEESQCPICDLISEKDERISELEEELEDSKAEVDKLETEAEELHEQIEVLNQEYGNGDEK